MATVAREGLAFALALVSSPTDPARKAGLFCDLTPQQASDTLSLGFGIALKGALVKWGGTPRAGDGTSCLWCPALPIVMR